MAKRKRIRKKNACPMCGGPIKWVKGTKVKIVKHTSKNQVCFVKDIKVFTY